MRVFAFFLLISPAAHADDALATAQKAYAEVDYPRCKEAAEKALGVPADKPARVDAWRLLGLCSAAVGETDKARDAFKHMLAIDKDARLPDGLSPRFTSSFREAKGSLVTGSPLGFTVIKETRDSGTRTIRLKLVDELDLVSKVAWRTPSGQQGAPVKAAPLQELTLPDTDVTFVALDQNGGEVAILLLPGKKADVAVAPLATAPVVEAPFPWLVVGGVAAGVVVLAAAGVGVALVLAPPQSVTLKTDVAFGN